MLRSSLDNAHVLLKNTKNEVLIKEELYAGVRVQIRLIPDPSKTGKIPDLIILADSLNKYITRGDVTESLKFFSGGKMLHQTRPYMLQVKSADFNGEPITVYNYIPRDVDILLKLSPEVEASITQVVKNMNLNLDTLLNDAEIQRYHRTPEFYMRRSITSNDYLLQSYRQPTLISRLPASEGFLYYDIVEDDTQYFFNLFTGKPIDYTYPSGNEFLSFFILPAICFFLNSLCMVRWYKLINRFRVNTEVVNDEAPTDLDRLSISSFLLLEVVMTMYERLLEHHKGSSLHYEPYFTLLQRVVKLSILGYVFLYLKLAMCKYVACIRTNGSFILNQPAQTSVKDLFILRQEEGRPKPTLYESCRFFVIAVADFLFTNRKLVSKNKKVYCFRLILTTMLWLYCKLRDDHLNTWIGLVPFLYFVPTLMRCLYYRIAPPQSGLEAACEYLFIISYILSMCIHRGSLFDGIFLPHSWTPENIPISFIIYTIITIIVLHEVVNYMTKVEENSDEYNYYNVEKMVEQPPSDCCICFESITPNDHYAKAKIPLDHLRKAMHLKTWKGSAFLGKIHRFVSKVKAPQNKSYSFTEDSTILSHYGGDTYKYWLEFTNLAVILTPCDHIFHTQCMNGWIKNNLSCPLCREKLIRPRPIGMLRSFQFADMKERANKALAETLLRSESSEAPL